MTGKKRIKQDEARVSVSGSVTKRMKETFYSYCNLEGLNPSRVIGKLVENWCINWEAEYYGKQNSHNDVLSAEEKYEQIALSFPCETVETGASKKQIDYIEGLCKMLNKTFKVDNIKTSKEADAKIKELLAIKNELREG